MKIKKLFGNFGQTIKAFSMSSIVIALITICVLLSIAGAFNNYDKFRALIVALILVFLLSLIGPICKLHSSKSIFNSNLFYIVSQVLPVLIGILYYFILPTEIYEGEAVILSYFGIFLIVILGIFVLISGLTRKNGEKTWYSWTKIITSCIFGVVASGILYGGIAGAFASIEALFDVYLSSGWYEYLGAITMILINGMLILNFYFTSMLELPKSDNFELNSSRMRKIFGCYIFLPLTLIYLLIFLSYGIKILITGVWPKGVIVGLGLGYFALGLIASYLTYPEKSTSYKKINQIIYISFFFISALMIGAIYLRIQQYGMTINRYLVCAGIVEMILFSVLSLFSYENRLLNLISSLFVLSIISLYTPVSAQRISFHSLNNQIDSLLKSEQISLPLGSGSLASLNDDSMAIAHGAFQELSENYDKSWMYKYFEPDFIENEEFYSSYNTRYLVRTYLGLEYVTRTEDESYEYFSNYTYDLVGFDIDGYKHIYFIEGFHSMDDESNILYIDIEKGNQSFRLDLNPYLQELYDFSKKIDVEKKSDGNDYFTIEDGNIKYIIKSYNGRKEKDQVDIKWIDGYILEK